MTTIESIIQMQLFPANVKVSQDLSERKWHTDPLVRRVHSDKEPAVCLGNYCKVVGTENATRRWHTKVSGRVCERNRVFDRPLQSDKCVTSVFSLIAPRRSADECKNCRLAREH